MVLVFMGHPVRAFVRWWGAGGRFIHREVATTRGPFLRNWLWGKFWVLNACHGWMAPTVCAPTPTPTAGARRAYGQHEVGGVAALATVPARPARGWYWHTPFPRQVHHSGSGGRTPVAAKARVPPVWCGTGLDPMACAGMLRRLPTPYPNPYP